MVLQYTKLHAKCFTCRTTEHHNNHIPIAITIGIIIPVSQVGKMQLKRRDLLKNIQLKSGRVRFQGGISVSNVYHTVLCISSNEESITLEGE